MTVVTCLLIIQKRKRKRKEIKKRNYIDKRKNESK